MAHSPVTITARAAAEIRKIVEQKKVPPGYTLRVGIRGGGCGAAGYFLGFDQPAPQDETWKVQEIELLVDKKHLMYLLDMEIDFEERKDEQGFVFNKKNASAAQAR